MKHFFKALCLPFLFMVFVPAYAQQTYQAEAFAAEQAEDLWYKNCVLYTLDIDAFMDSDSSGMGDFNGLTQQLDYLHALGADVIWLAPFQPSPNRDNGYDISDYYSVNPKFGDGGDFVEFMHQARNRGMKVIMDLVINHTSDENPWFQQSRQNPDSKYRSWYVWSEEQPDDWNEGMVFPGVQEESWTYDSAADAYYSHRFYEFQPDLNYNNPEVMAEMKRVMGYWLWQGLDGFRIDAAPFIIEDPFSDRNNPTHRFKILEDIRRFMQSRNGQAVMLGEANVPPEENKDYFGEKGEGMQLMFNFYVNQHLFYALASAELEPLIEALEQTKDIPPTAQWANFLRNHDEIDLDRLTDAQQEVVFEQFGPEPDMQLYERGIRRRLAPMLDNPAQLRMAYSLLFSLPGVPVLRYGDEIGMGDDLDLEEREAVRTPMQWSDAPQAGFSASPETDRPVIDEGPYSYEQVNVAEQQQDPHSLLNWTARMVRLRKEHPEIGLGDWQILDSGSPHVLVMQYQWKERSLIVAHNFSGDAQQAQIQPPAQGQPLRNLLSEDDEQANAEGIYQLDLEAYGYQWYSVQANP